MRFYQNVIVVCLVIFSLSYSIDSKISTHLFHQSRGNLSSNQTFLTTNTQLNFTGSQCGDTPLTCPSGQDPMSFYICSDNDALWNDGTISFNDPIPSGNVLYHMSLEFFGRFFCDEGQPKATFVVLINDNVLLSSRFPDTPTLCNCTTNCGVSTLFESDDNTMDYTSYKYGQSNIFHLLLVTNDICLSYVNITFYYTPFVINVNSIVPDTGSVSGGTLVTALGDGWTNVTGWWCIFGQTPARATYINESALSCLSPAVSGPGNVSFSISFNYDEYSNHNLYFNYTQVTSESVFDKILSQYWWLLLIGSLVILLAISFFILTFKSKKKANNRPGLFNSETTTPLLLGNNSSSSLIRFKEDIDFKEIKLGERIGRGNFGEVYIGYWRNTSVAVKKCKINVDSHDQQEILDDFEREAQIMRSLRHPNVIQFLGICDNGNSEICIITEYMPRGSLYKILHDRSTVLEWDLRLRIALDIARGMNYLHKCNPIIIHRDLKSHNLLVDENFKVKVCDFGLAKLIHEEAVSAMTSCGTPAWTAPEVLRNEKYDERCDCYSFGIVLWELLTREDPHHGMPPFQVVFAVGTQGIRPTIPSSCPSDFGHLIEELWSENPRDRVSFNESISRLEQFSRSKLFSHSKV